MSPLKKTNPALQPLDPMALRGLRLFWLGAVTFEDRSLASLQRLSTLGLQFRGGVALDYGAAIDSQLEAERHRRQEKWALFDDLADELFPSGARKRAVDPYVFDDIRGVLEDILARSGVDRVMIDLTSVTNIHSLAVGAVVGSSSWQQRCIFLHTSPLNYAFIDEESSEPMAWRDILFAPLAETAELHYESHGRGIVLLGPEVERLIVAIAEIEPAGGIVVEPQFEGRPDLSYFVRTKNQRIAGQLVRLPAGTWKQRRIQVGDLESLAIIVQDEIDQARSKGAPAILFPFGPKPLTVLSSFLLAKNYPESAWFVYPIPRRHDVDVTYGVGETFAFSLD